jgi:hypothetical protein
MERRQWLLVAGWIVLGLAAGCAGDSADSDGGVLDVIDAKSDAEVDGFTDGGGTAEGPLMLDAADATTPDAPEALAPETIESLESSESPLEILDEDTGLDTKTDETTDAGGEEACTHQGFAVASTTAETCLANEGGFLYLAVADSTSYPVNIFGLELLLSARATGSYEFTDENYATCERCIRIDAGCASEGGCDKIFLVYGGHMDINAWEDPGGHFTVTFTELRAREVTIATEMPLTSTPVDGGETWCIDTLALDVAPLAEM